jgi:hypothetical protein
MGELTLQTFRDLQTQGRWLQRLDSSAAALAMAGGGSAVADDPAELRSRITTINRETSTDAYAAVTTAAVSMQTGTATTDATQLLQRASRATSASAIAAILAASSMRTGSDTISLASQIYATDPGRGWLALGGLSRDEAAVLAVGAAASGATPAEAAALYDEVKDDLGRSELSAIVTSAALAADVSANDAVAAVRAIFGRGIFGPLPEGTALAAAGALLAGASGSDARAIYEQMNRAAYGDAASAGLLTATALLSGESASTVLSTFRQAQRSSFETYDAAVATAALLGLTAPPGMSDLLTGYASLAGRLESADDDDD